MPKNEKKSNIFKNVGITLVALIVLVIALLTLIPVQIDGTLTCNTGFVGLDIESENVIQNITCTDRIYDPNTGTYNRPRDKHWENVTCFKEDMLFKHIKVKNIDGMNCYGSANVEIPLIAYLFMPEDE
jgi:hypothetical protein